MSDSIISTSNYTTLYSDAGGTVSAISAGGGGFVYDISATTTTGGANFNLNSTSPSVDTIKFANGANMTIVATSDNIITFAATDTNTTYTYTAEPVLGGVYLRLAGSDSSIQNVKLTSGTGVSASWVNNG
jgi:hypothetical protein